MPTVSVIIPMYQSAATVAETVRSVQEDALDCELEVVVVNDGSTDHGPAIVERISREDARIRLIHQENAGLANARNTGIQAARGRYLRFLDADDWALPGSTTRLVDAAEEGGTGAACGTMELRDQAGRSLNRSIPARHGPDRTVGLDQLLDSNAMGVGTVMIRRDVLGELQFRPFWGCEDYDLWARLALAGVRFAVVGEPAVKGYRLHAASMSRNFDRMCASAIEVTRSTFAAAMKDERWNGMADLSRARLARASAGGSLGFASMAAAGGDIDGALRILEANAVSAEWEWAGTEVGTAFIVGVAQALAAPPQARGLGRATWVMCAHRWLDVLVERGAMASGERGPAWRAMAASIVTPEMVTHEVASAIQNSGANEVVLLGFGRNGRLLACELAKRGVRVRVRDERWPDGCAPANETRLFPDKAGWVRVSPEGMSGPIRASAAAPVVVTPNNDERLLGHAGAADPLRWREVAVTLAEAENTDLVKIMSNAGLAAATAVERGCPSGR